MPDAMEAGRLERLEHVVETGESALWDSATPPGGYVCLVCGVPVESEPCERHDWAWKVKQAEVEGARHLLSSDAAADHAAMLAALAGTAALDAYAREQRADEIEQLLIRHVDLGPRGPATGYLESRIQELRHG